MRKKISFILNGRQVEKEVDIRKSLLEMLREDFHMKGTKESCSVGECGACSVIVDGTTLDSCIYLAVWAHEKSVVTIEGIASEDGLPNDVQQHYIEAGAVQCGFCTPGLIVASTSLVNQHKNLTRDEIRSGLSGNICRCTGYHKIVDAVEMTVKGRQEREGNDGKSN